MRGSKWFENVIYLTAWNNNLTVSGWRTRADILLCWWVDVLKACRLISDQGASRGRGAPRPQHAYIERDKQGCTGGTGERVILETQKNKLEARPWPWQKLLLWHSRHKLKSSLCVRLQQANLGVLKVLKKHCCFIQNKALKVLNFVHKGLKFFVLFFQRIR